MELVPQPLALLIRRALREREAHKSVFDLPLAKMWHGSPVDLSRRFHGHRASTVVGPAAGPHTQLAQNIALSFLSGARICELKTVQINDRLVIPRPCIDATNVGFNVEWSQELRVSESQTEYAKAALLLAALQRMGLPEGLDHAKDGATILDLSLGYDLKGIQSDSIGGFIGGMLDASSAFDRMLGELPDDLKEFRDLSVKPRLVDAVTLSTFHGCPADEIELIARHLMEDWKLNVVIKLNPTLLGFEDVKAILNDQLGYQELVLQKPSFDKDLMWPQAIEMIGRLRTVAIAQGVKLGVKLTNTMIVDNHKTFFADKEMYLSGQPLHVLATQLMSRLRTTLPAGEVPLAYTFSAGIDQHNFVDAVASDLCPVTVCTDLLRPGGYARLPKYLDQLAADMTSNGVTDVESFIVKRGDPIASLEEIIDLVPGDKNMLRARAEALVEGRAATIADLSLDVRARWVHAAGSRTAIRYAAQVLKDPKYAAPKNSKVPKKIGSMLHLFDCVSCDKCIPVCPNDANFVYDVAPGSRVAPSWRVEGSNVVVAETTKLPIEQVHQLATFVDSCNACGNCDVFCPEDGGPYNMKPHWFGNEKTFHEGKVLDGFYLPSKDAIVGRLEGKVVRLDVDRANATGTFDDGLSKLEVKLSAQGPEMLRFELKGAPEGHVIRGDRIVVLAALLDGVLSTVNPVSVALP